MPPKGILEMWYPALQRRLGAIALAILGICCSMQAEEIVTILETFEDEDVFDGDPIRWRTDCNSGGAFNVSSGGLALWNVTPRIAAALALDVVVTRRIQLRAQVAFENTAGVNFLVHASPGRCTAYVVGFRSNGEIGVRYVGEGPTVRDIPPSQGVTSIAVDPSAEYLMHLDVTIDDTRPSPPFQRFALTVWPCGIRMPDEPTLVAYDDDVTSGYVGLSSCDDCGGQMADSGKGLYRFFWLQAQLADYEAPAFVRGDANSDSAVDTADAIFTLGYLFARGSPPACMDAADANDNGKVDIADGIYVLQHLFANGPGMPAPSRGCGYDPTYDTLNCGLYSVCPWNEALPECE
jgi:hypothetical protein